MNILKGRLRLLPLLLVALGLVVAACGDDSVLVECQQAFEQCADGDCEDWGRLTEEGQSDRCDRVIEDHLKGEEPDEESGAATSNAEATAHGKAEPTDVTFMLDWTPNTNHAGIYIAKAKGWYEEAGLDVEIVEPGAGGVEQTVASGGAHFGVSVQENVIPARAQGIPVVAIAAVIEHNTSSLIALAEEGIEGPGDLAGKTYGGWGGPLETALISALVECGGGDPGTVEYAIIGNVDYIVGMEQGDYDFVWIFDAWDGIRYTEVLGRDVSFVRFIDHTDCIPDWYTPVIISSESLIADDPDLVEAFMEATARGYRHAIENPEEAAEILLEAAPELDEALVKASAAYLADLYTSDPDNWGRQELDVWTRFERFLREAGLTESAVDVEAAFTNDFLP